MPAGRRDKFREITSSTNPLLKVFRRALAEGVTRDGGLAVEGPHFLQEALTAGARVRSVLAGRSAAEKFRALLERLPGEAEVVQVPDSLFKKVAATEAPQGLAAIVELEPADLDALLSRPNPVFVVACGIQDPGNLGTMVRSGQSLGATALVAVEDTVSPFNPKALRASAGAVFRLPILADFKAQALFERFRAAAIRIVAADARSPMPLAGADLKGPVAFLIGREGTGLPDELTRQASLLLGIPIRPGMDSINAATAASIFLYEAARQRGFKYS